MKAVVIIVQVFLSLVLVASLMPLVLVMVPWMRQDRVGLVAVITLFAAVFVLIRLVWPRRSKAVGQAGRRS